MITEDEAKEKWCPRAHNGADQPCIGTKCMAWRWVYETEQDPETFDEVRVFKKGFCGLAGYPE